MWMESFMEILDVMYQELTLTGDGASHRKYFTLKYLISKKESAL